MICEHFRAAKTSQQHAHSCLFLHEISVHSLKFPFSSPLPTLVLCSTSNDQELTVKLGPWKEFQGKQRGRQCLVEAKHAGRVEQPTDDRGLHARRIFAQGAQGHRCGKWTTIRDPTCHGRCHRKKTPDGNGEPGLLLLGPTGDQIIVQSIIIPIPDLGGAHLCRG